MGAGSLRVSMDDKSQVTVRSARPEDVHYIRSLSEKVFQQYGPYEDILVGWFESGITITFIAWMDRQAVGFAMLSRLRGEWYRPRVSELLAIAVEPEKWRIGVGDLLMRRIEGKARELKMEMLGLHTAVDNLAGQKLFRKCGFIPLDVKEHFYPLGQDALMMYKDMDRALV